MISKQAYVDPTAKLGNNVEVMPFAFIGEDVEIGDNCIIMPYAGVLKGTTIGKKTTESMDTLSWELIRKISNITAKQVV